MNKRNKKLLFIVLIIVLVSASFVISKITDVSADSAPSGSLLTETPLGPVSNTVETGLSDSGSIYWALLKMLGALSVVIAAIFGFMYLLRRLMGQKVSGKKDGQLLEVMETAYVGQKKSVSLVRFVDRSVLIGISDNNISVLAELSQDETEKISVQTETPNSNAIGFKNIFNDAREKLSNLQLNLTKKGSKLDSQAA